MFCADVSYPLLFKASLQRDIFCVCEHRSCHYDLELFSSPLLFSHSLHSPGRTGYHPGDSLLCLSKLFAKEGKHLYTRHAISKSVLWNRAESEREYKLWVQGLFQLSLKCSCLWGWAQLWNKHHHCTVCQDEEGIHCPSEKRTSYELNVITQMDVSQYTWACSLLAKHKS